MAHAFLKLVNGGNQKGSIKGSSASSGPNLSHLLSSTNPSFGQSNPLNSLNNSTSYHNSEPIRLNSNATNNLDLFAANKKKLTSKEDSSTLTESNKKGLSTKQRKFPLPSGNILQQLQQKHAILVDGEDVPTLLPTFDLIQQEYPIPPYIASNLKASLHEGGFGFVTPTPIQMQTIPSLMSSRDVMAFAPTGSGKTLAFALPMIQQLFQTYLTHENKPPSIQIQNQNHTPNLEPPAHSKYALPIHALILCPTRELALQTHRVYKKLLRKRQEYSQQLEKDNKNAQEFDDFFPQALLLTKRWKTRCINTFHSAVLGSTVKTKGKNSYTGEIDADADEDEDDDQEIDSKLTSFEQELQDDDDDGIDYDLFDIDLKNNDLNNKNQAKKKRQVYNIVIATPLLLLSLLDRCYRIMKRDYTIKYQMFLENQWDAQQLAQKQLASLKVGEKNNKKIPTNTSILSSPPIVNENELVLPKVLGQCGMFVLDECDRLLDLGFLQQVNNVLSHAQRVQNVPSTDTSKISSSTDRRNDNGDDESNLSLAEKKKRKILAEKKKQKQVDITPAGSAGKTTPLSSNAIVNSTRMITVLVSATITPAINILSSKMLTLPIKITIGEENVAQLSIKQKLVYCMNEDGKKLGIKQIISQGSSLPMLVFLQSKERTMQLYQELEFTFQNLFASSNESIYDSVINNTRQNNNTPSLLTQNISSTTARQNAQKFSRIGILHSDLPEGERVATMTRFRIGELWILLCTDVISRGLDFIHVKCVVNYDFPGSTTSYLHRIGRTGRGGQKGTAITFITDDDKTLLPNVAQIVKHSEELQMMKEKTEFCDSEKAEMLEANQQRIDNGDLSLDDIYTSEAYTFYNDINNIQNNLRPFVEYLQQKKKIGLLVQDFEEPGCPEWMSALRLASARQQQELLYKQPIRDNIVPTSTGKHDKFKTKQMNTFHKRKQIAGKLGIVTRNEVGRQLNDKLDKDNKQSTRNDQLAQENTKKNTINKQGDKFNHSPTGPQKRKKMVGFVGDNDGDHRVQIKKMKNKRE